MIPVRTTSGLLADPISVDHSGVTNRETTTSNVRFKDIVFFNQESWTIKGSQRGRF